MNEKASIRRTEWGEREWNVAANGTGDPNDGARENQLERELYIIINWMKFKLM